MSSKSIRVPVNTFLVSKLKRRAALMGEVRHFFAQRGVIEVDTPILSPAAPIDPYIDIMEVDVGRGKVGYLHSSPEYELKKLLSAGSGDIYQLSHVFRQNEEGPLHRPEFMMIEWYRIGMDYFRFIEETVDLLRLFLGNLPFHLLTYRDAFQTRVGIDIGRPVDFAQVARAHHLELSQEAIHWDKDTWLTLLFSSLIEPSLGQEELCVITEYPASQAALSKTTHVAGMDVARRFEIYYRGIELANGFEELTDPIEQRRRFEQDNRRRVALGKKALPIDESFLAALEAGMPESCGVAVGFDRLVMLHLKETSI